MNKKCKQILAIIAIVILAGMYIAAFILAFLDFPGKMQMFTSCIVATIFVPILLWALIWMVGVLSNKKNIASFRSEEMEETMEKAEQIKYSMELEKMQAAQSESDFKDEQSKE